MLQQTTVKAVVPYFERWMARFPDVAALASAPLDEVLAHWQGLGYYRRARHLHAGARHVAEHGLPAGAEAWREVPGVGLYTAGAVASIAQGEAAALVDGNVERVYARFVGDAATGSDLTRNAWAWARSVVDASRPGDWNQALMELGATVCTPRGAACLVCPWRESCVAHAQGRVETLPTPMPKRATVELRHVVWIPTWGAKVGVRPVPDGGWWAGMWEFPREEGVERLAALVHPVELRPLLGFRHTVTHHRITVDLAEAVCDGPRPGLEWLTPEETAHRAMPAPARRALAQLTAGEARQSEPRW